MRNTTYIPRGWSKRYPTTSRWREALADCVTCGKFAVLYFDGVATCEPYQVRGKARKTKTRTARIEPSRDAAIIALFGSFQNFVDTANITMCNTQQ